MYIAVDFDGTCVTHDYPNVGEDIGAVSVLKTIVKNGHKLILNTMRDKRELQDAIDWFKANDIPLFGANRNPTQNSWTTSPKVYAHIYIDDAALGCPLIYDTLIHDRPFVNWGGVARQLESRGIITYEQLKDIEKEYE